MKHTAKIDPALSSAIDDDVMDEMENNEATGMFEYKPESEHLTADTHAHSMIHRCEKRSSHKNESWEPPVRSFIATTRTPVVLVTSTGK